MMQTDELITLLATRAGPVENPIPARRCIGVLLPAALISGATAFLWLGFVPMSFFLQMGPWLKLALGTALVLAGTTPFLNAGQPGTRNRTGLFHIAAIFTAVLALGLLQLVASADVNRSALVWGHSWAQCPTNILTLSLPLLIGTIYLMRRLAPTRPMQAGAYAGLLAGSISAMIYALACTETAFMFIAIWYGAGILLTTLVGCLIGRVVFRW